LQKIWNSKFFSAEETVVSERTQKEVKVLFETNQLGQDQISEIWPKKGQSGNPADLRFFSKKWLH